MSEDVEPGSHKPAPVVKSTSVMRRFVIYSGVLLVETKESEPKE